MSAGGGGACGLGGADVSLRPQSRMRAHVLPHVQMPYKQGSGYWNSV